MRFSILFFYTANGRLNETGVDGTHEYEATKILKRKKQVYQKRNLILIIGIDSIRSFENDFGKDYIHLIFRSQIYTNK